MRSRLLLLASLAPIMALLAATAPPVPVPVAVSSPLEIMAAAPAADWVAIAPADLLVMDLSPDAAGRARRVVIQLMPPPFSQGWVGNIRTLAAAHWWDGTSVNRVQDNYVVQWGDANAEDKAKAKALPAGLVKVAEREYEHAATFASVNEPETEMVNLSVTNLSRYVNYRAVRGGVGFEAGWPFAYAEDRKREAGVWPSGTKWPVHCYGMVGVGRDMPPDTGTGAELYTVIGQAPRHLDRNIALVGRVVSGIENLSSLPRGTGPLGFYEKPEQRTTIVSVRLASDLPERDRPRFQYLSTESASFARYADARANRRDAFFIRPAGRADICNVPVPIRRTP